MSANRWSNCPRCLKRREDQAKRAVAILNEAYGKDSASEWLELKKELEITEPLEPSLREDWEITLTGDKLEIDYLCHCKVCGMSGRFTHEEILV
jgi:hypothetical protein